MLEELSQWLCRKIQIPIFPISQFQPSFAACPAPFLLTPAAWRADPPAEFASSPAPDPATARFLPAGLVRIARVDIRQEGNREAQVSLDGAIDVIVSNVHKMKHTTKKKTDITD
jgi:hypothetical protein